MLKRLRIANFQCLRFLDVEFDPLVTVFIAPNDSGKSSILRALRWLSLNQPSGEEFINWDSDRVRAKLWVDEHTIYRSKGKGNIYQLDGEEFKAFGNSVPEAIANTLNLGDTNFQQQLSLPFWFCESAGKVSRQLNQIVDLGVIDRVISGATSRLRSARTKVEISEQRLREAKERKKELAWVVDFRKDLSEVENLHYQLDNVSEECSRIASLFQEGEDIQKRAADSSETILDGLLAISTGQETLQIDAEIENLSRIIQSLEAEQQWLSQAKSNIQLAEDEFATRTMNQICPVCQQPFPHLLRFHSEEIVR